MPHRPTFPISSMSTIFRFFILVCAGVSLREVDADPQSRLAELPLSKLLNVKQGLAQDINRLLTGAEPDVEEDVEIEVEPDDEADDNGARNGGAMPLKGDWFQQQKPRYKPTKVPSRRGDWDWEKGEKKGDVSKIFETTVTVLAFLAFGGYLLCVIIMSLRNNQGLFQGVFPTAAPTAAPINAGRRKREAFPVDDSPFVHSLTESLHRLAEGYAKYHFND